MSKFDEGVKIYSIDEERKELVVHLGELREFHDEYKKLKEENQLLRMKIQIYNTTYGLQRNKPEFVDTRFMQRGKYLGQSVSLERCYKCPKCNTHLFLKVHKHKYCPECGLKFDRSEIDKED